MPPFMQGFETRTDDIQAMIQWMDFIGNISECRSYTNRLMLKMEADMFFIFLI